MAAGLPILFSGDGEARSIIENHNLGWTSPAKDYDALKDNIRKFCSLENDLALKRMNCLQAAATLFNRSRQIDSLHQYLVQSEK